MLKMLLSTTALITALGSVSLAQEATDAEEPMVEAQEPAGTGEAADATAIETATDPAAADPAVTAESEASEIETADTGPTLMPVDISDVTVGKLMDANLQTPDGEDLGTIDDAKFGDGGTIESVVVSFGGFLGFGERTVELPLDEFKLMQDEAGDLAAETTLTPEDIEKLPDYVEAPAT